MTPSEFLDSFEKWDETTERQKVESVVYYITEIAGDNSANLSGIRAFFEAADVQVPNRLSAYLSEGLSAKYKQYVGGKGNYRLNRESKARISALLGTSKPKSSVSTELRNLGDLLDRSHEISFFSEAINCFEIGATRASIIMTWVLTMDRLHTYVFEKNLSAFNEALAKNPAGKIKFISDRNDIGEMKEGKFLELCRASKTLSGDEYKILDSALGVRNTAAHPANVIVAESKAVAVIEDLVRNIVSKF